METVLTHRERMEKCLSGETLANVPVALWRHFPVDDQQAGTLAKAIVNFQNIYKFDFIKVTPASSYCIKDWGVQDKWTGNPHGTRDYTVHVIHQPEDWLQLSNLDPQEGQLGMVSDCLKLLVREYEKKTPIIHTIFSPLAQAKNLIGPDKLPIHIRKYPDAVHAGLKMIADNTINYIHHISALGIDGIFYAIQHAQLSILSQEEFKEFGKDYDHQILNQLKNLWLNVGHIHGNDIMFEDIIDYPVQIMNWHDQETFPSLAEAKKIFSGVVCGGLKQEETMVKGTPNDVRREAKKAIMQTNGNRFVLGTGCVLPTTSPFGNIKSVVNSTKR